jgi:hypothetical protein
MESVDRTKKVRDLHTTDRRDQTRASQKAKKVVEVDVEDSSEEEVEVVQKPKSSKKKRSPKLTEEDGTPLKRAEVPDDQVRMTWGKYRSKLVKDVIEFDEKYAEWMYRQEFVEKFEDIFRVLNKKFGN